MIIAVKGLHRHVSPLAGFNCMHAGGGKQRPWHEPSLCLTMTRYPAQGRLIFMATPGAAHECKESSKRGEWGDIGAYTCVAALPLHNSKIEDKCKNRRARLSIAPVMDGTGVSNFPICSQCSAGHLWVML